MNYVRWSARCASIARRLTNVDCSGKRYIARWIRPTMIEIVKRKVRARPVEPEPLRNSFLEWNYDAEIYAFNSRLSEKFDTELLSSALTFRSYVVKGKQEQLDVGITEPLFDVQDNTDLIEEGQKLTDRIIGAYLCRALPRAPLECINALRSYLTSSEILAKVSSQIGTRDLILSAEQPISEETLAYAFYALVSALSRSTNDAIHVAKFVRDFLIACLSEKELTEIWCPSNPENVLNSILARENREIVEPRLIGQAGTHTLLAAYHVGLYSNKELLGRGFGETIEEGRKAAAIAALNRMFGMGDSCKPIRYDLTIDPATSEIGTGNLPLARWCNKNVEKIMLQ